jgi:ribosomal protein S11
MKTGLPKKFAKLGFKKGWKLFKASKKRPKTKKRKTKRAIKKNRNPRIVLIKTPERQSIKKIKKGAKKMAKKRRKTTRPARRRRAQLIPQKVMNILIDSGIIGVSAVGATALVNMTPVVKDWPAWQKALLQALAGVFGLTMARNIMLKRAFSGSMVAAAISLLIPFMPAGFKFAGARPLTSAEMAALAQNTMGRGVPIPTMGKPVSIPMAGSRARETNR